MDKKLAKLKTILAEVNDLNGASALLTWDQQTYMPSGGAERRGQQLGTLQSLAHQKFISPEVGRILEELEPLLQTLDPDSDDARLIKVTARDYQKLTRVPTEWVQEFAEETTVATQVWQEARAEDNFTKFQPHLEKIVDLRRRYAGYFAPYTHIYDPLLNDFEPGLQTKEVIQIFETIRPLQVDLIKQIAAKAQVDDSFLHLEYDGQKQWDFGVNVISKFGYDWNHGRQDKSVHPFTIGFGVDDVRITTRVIPNYLNTALFGTMHETGHALYELGVDHAYARTPLEGGASMAIHESQSRLYENLVGRSLPFWEHFYPSLQALFPDQLSGVNLPTFYKGINKVEPSLIRVEADEATYNLHIMLRLELEIALIEGSLEVKDLPTMWRQKMQEYIGLTPETEADGVLQDIHWSGGMIGYFPTYALGNLVSVQLWEKIMQDIPDMNEQIKMGEFKELLGWLRENVHRYGAKYEPQELVERVTGSKIDPTPYIRYLTAKFSQIYEI